MRLEFCGRIRLKPCPRRELSTALRRPPSDSTMEGLIGCPQRNLPLVTLARFYGQDNQPHHEHNRKPPSLVDRRCTREADSTPANSYLLLLDPVGPVGSLPDIHSHSGANPAERANARPFAQLPAPALSELDFDSSLATMFCCRSRANSFSVCLEYTNSFPMSRPG
jgi:hypothetical protein